MLNAHAHLFTAFAKFLAAGIDASAATRGILGFWLGAPPWSVARTVVPHSDDIRVRTSQASAAWDIECPQFPNPYTDILAFLDSGGDIGRWENNVLDVYLPSGNWTGIPLATFIGAAANNSFKPTPHRGVGRVPTLR